MANTIRIKRRLAGVGVLSTAPTGLQNAELAYNEESRKLYYGFGIAVEGSTAAAEAIEIAGPGYSEALDIATREALTTIVRSVSTTLQTNINGVNAGNADVTGLVNDITAVQGRATALEAGTTQLSSLVNAVNLSAWALDERTDKLEAGTTQLSSLVNAVNLSAWALDERVIALETAPAVNLAELGDITIGAAYEIADGSVLKYNATLSAWEAGTDATGGGGSTSLAGLTDVLVSEPVADGSVLKYNATSSKWEVGTDATGGGGASNLAELGDIFVGAAYEIADGSVLKYNAALSAWEAGTDATGGGGTNRDADINSLLTGFNTLTGNFATVPVLGPLATVALGASVTLATLTLTAASTFQENITFTKGASMSTLSATAAVFTTIGANNTTGALSGFTADGSQLALVNFSLDGGTF